MIKRREKLSVRIDTFFKVGGILFILAGISFFVGAFVWNLIKQLWLMVI